MIRYIRLFWAVVFSFLMMSVPLATPVHAQNEPEVEDYKKPMPDIAGVEDSDFLTQTVEYRDDPFREGDLSYAVRLPAEWRKASDESATGSDMRAISSKILSEVGRYYGPVNHESGFPSRFVVSAESLDYELTAEQWFMQYLIANGYALQGMKTIDDERAEAIYVMIERDTSFVVRALAIKSGKEMVLAQYYMPIQLWENDKHMQASVIDKFKLVRQGDELVEKMKPYHFLDIAAVQYPVSWHLRAPPMRSIDRMTISLLNIPHQAEGAEYQKDRLVLDGKIDISLVSAYVSDSMDEEIALLKSGLEKKGMELSAIDEPGVVQVVPNLFVDKKAVAFKAVSTESKLLKYEYWVTGMEYGDYFYMVSLLTPSREDDYYVWSRNTETYKLILSLVNPEQNSLVSH